MAHLMVQLLLNMRQQWRQWLGVVALLAVYVGSESTLRKVVYSYHPNDVTMKAQIDQWISNLPPVIKDLVEHRRQLRKLRADVAAATTPEKKIAAYNALAGHVGGSEQQQCYAQIVALAPTAPATAQPLILMLRDDPPEAALKRYVEFAHGCQYSNPVQRLEVWQMGLGLLHAVPEDRQFEYLQELAHNDFVASGLMDAYEQLRGLAAQRGDEALLIQAKALYEKCEQRYLAEAKGPGH